MKPYAKDVPIDRIKGRGGKKSHYCRCCISKKCFPGTRNQKKAIREQMRKEMFKEVK